MEIIKTLDANGVKVLYDLLSLQDYPNNEVLGAVINAIDETKADIVIIPENPIKNIIEKTIILIVRDLEQ